MRKLIITAAIALAASGCATQQGTNAATTEIDAEYVASVENNARRFGTKIYWLEMPRREVKPAKAEPARK